MQRRRSSGFTLVELLIALIISLIVAGMGTYKAQLDARETLGKAQGTVIARIKGAVDTYLTNNYAALVNGTAVTGVAAPMAPTVTELQTLGILDGTASTSNFYGGSYKIQISKVPAACTPPNCNIAAKIWLTNSITYPVTGTIDGVALGAAIQEAGSDAGYSLPESNGTITGLGGNWSDTNPAGSVSGILAMRAGYGSSAMAAFLRRDGSLPMTGNLDLGSNTLNNAAAIVLNTPQTANTACTTVGTVARDSTGAVLSCISTTMTWQNQGSAYWKDPVANLASLPTCNASSAWQTRIVETPTTGSGPRAYTCNGASWQALSVDDSGNLTVAGLLTVGKLYLQKTVVAGAACNPAVDGNIAVDSSGLALSCQSGVWQRSGVGLQKAHGLASNWPSGFVCNTSAGTTLFLAVQLYAGVLYFDVPYSSGNYIGVSTSTGIITGQAGSSYYCPVATIGVSLFGLISAANIFPIY